MLTGHSCFSTEPHDISFRFHRASSQRGLNVFFETAYLIWTHYVERQNSLSSANVFPLDVEVRFTSYLVIFPSYLQKLLNPEQVLTAKLRKFDNSC